MFGGGAELPNCADACVLFPDVFTDGMRGRLPADGGNAGGFSVQFVEARTHAAIG